jgi:hypothetical protein
VVREEVAPRGRPAEDAGLDIDVEFSGVGEDPGMRYTDLLRLAGSHERAHALARTALLPYLRSGIDARAIRANLRDGMTFADGPHPGALGGPKAALLDVPRRVLKRWATRAALTGIPRELLLKGPRLAMSRRNSMYLSRRGFLP